VNLQVDEEFLASLNPSTTQISITSSTKVVVKVAVYAQNEERIGEALRNIKPLNTLSPLKTQMNIELFTHKVNIG
jgi:hypothetical protein